MLVNFYYDDSGELTSDDEGCLVQLCGSCAKLHSDKVRKASRGHDQSTCELCGASNDPDWTESVNRMIARLTRP